MNPKGEREDLNALILSAQNGSVEAYEELLCRYRPLIDSSVSGFVTGETSRQEAEDMHEEARHIFLNAITTYDLDRDGVDFGLYAKICLKNGLISELRRQKHRRRLGVVSLSSDELDDGRITSSDDDPAQMLMEEENFRALYRSIRTNLSEFENTVWWMYVSGMSASDIAKALDREERSVHNAIYRIRVKLRGLLSK